MGAALTPAAVLAQRQGTPWLVATGADSFWSQLADFQRQLQTTQSRDVLLVESDPVRFLAAFLAAVQHCRRLWLGNPQWGTQEWIQVAAYCQPDWVIGNLPPHWQDLGTETGTPPSLSLPGDESLILIPTGGSSGNLRFAAHTWQTLAASVQGFCQHFDSGAVHAYCVLPLYHVSGLMQAVRCWLSEGQLVIQPFRELLAEGPLTSPWDSDVPDSFLSLVPTQLQRLLARDREIGPWLRQFRAILLGGAPPWPSLLQAARDRHLPLAPTYGMTETASQVATLLPQAFLAGQTGSGQPLPHARLMVQDAHGHALPPHRIGQIAVDASSLALAVGSTAIAPPWQTGDLGYLDELGYLHVLGRAQGLIITGGEKVQPEEVEATILATGIVRDVAVLGVPDGDWGEQVVAIVVNSTAPESAIADRLEQLRTHLKTQLSAYKIPKVWLVRPALPRNAQGKLNRADLRQWTIAQINATAATTESAPASEDGADG